MFTVIKISSNSSSNSKWQSNWIKMENSNGDGFKPNHLKCTAMNDTSWIKFSGGCFLLRAMDLNGNGRAAAGVSTKHVIKWMTAVQWYKELIYVSNHRCISLFQICTICLSAYIAIKICVIKYVYIQVQNL